MANPNPTTRSREQDWSEKQIKQLEKLYPNTDKEVIAEKLGKSVGAIRSQAGRLNLKKSTRYWDKPEEDYVLANWLEMTADEIAEGLKQKFGIDKTRWAVINKYRELAGLR